MPHDADLIDAADLLLYLGLPETTDPRVYESMITAVSLAIEGFCGNALRRRTFTEVYARPSRRELYLRHYPIVSITSITDPAGNAVASTEYVVIQRSGVLRHSGYWPVPVTAAGLVAEWAVVYVAGRYATIEDVDEDLKLACRLLAAHRSSLRTPGIASKSAGDRSISYRSPSATESRGIPDEVAGLLSPYVSHNV